LQSDCRLVLSAKPHDVNLFSSQFESYTDLSAIVVIASSPDEAACGAIRGIGAQLGFGWFPSSGFTAIKLSLFRNAKLQLGIREYRAKLELGIPFSATSGLMHLNLMAVKLWLGNPYIASSCLVVLREAGVSKTSFPSKSLGTSYKEVIFDHNLKCNPQESIAPLLS